MYAPDKPSCRSSVHILLKALGDNIYCQEYWCKMKFLCELPNIYVITGTSTVPLLSSISCQIYFALFYTSESWSTKKSKIILNKLNIKEAQCLFNLYIWFVFRVQCLLFIWVETSSKIKFSSSICTLDNVMYILQLTTYVGYFWYS